MKNKKLSLNEIEKALKSIDIKYSVRNPIQHAGLEFCSLRKIVPSGIYYIEGNVVNTTDFTNSLLITNDEKVNIEDCTIIYVDRPQLSYYLLMKYFFTKEVVGFIHPTAQIHPDARVNPNAYIGPFCVIGNAVINSGVKLYSHVVLFDNVTLEENVYIESHSTIGATGVAWVRDNSGKRVTQPQIGSVLVGKNTFLGSDVSIVRGSVNESTEIGANCVIAHGSKIGHGSRIGDEVHFANNVSIAGNVDIGDNSFLGSGAVIRPMIVLAKRTIIAAGCVVVKNVNQQNMLVSGVPGVAKLAPARMSGVPGNV